MEISWLQQNTDAHLYTLCLCINEPFTPTYSCYLKNNRPNYVVVFAAIVHPFLWPIFSCNTPIKSSTLIIQSSESAKDIM